MIKINGEEVVPISKSEYEHMAKQIEKLTKENEALIKNAEFWQSKSEANKNLCLKAEANFMEISKENEALRGELSLHQTGKYYEGQLEAMRSALNTNRQLHADNAAMKDCLGEIAKDRVVLPNGDETDILTWTAEIAHETLAKIGEKR